MRARAGQTSGLVTVYYNDLQEEEDSRTRFPCAVYPRRRHSSQPPPVYNVLSLLLLFINIVVKTINTPSINTILYRCGGLIILIFALIILYNKYLFDSKLAKTRCREKNIPVARVRVCSNIIMTTRCSIRNVCVCVRARDTPFFLFFYITRT